MKIAGINIEIINVPTLGGTPARCTIIEPTKRALIQIANDKMDDYPVNTRFFVILHELGHAVLNTGNEIEVDRWACKQYAKSGKPMKGAVFAVSNVLDPCGHAEHSERVKRQFYRAKHYSFLRGKITTKQFFNQKV